MVDFRPLLFANALILMLLVTAGFASLQPDMKSQTELAQSIRDADTVVQPGDSLEPANAANDSTPSQPRPGEHTGEIAAIHDSDPFADTTESATTAAPTPDVATDSPSPQSAQSDSEVAEIDSPETSETGEPPLEVATVDIDLSQPEATVQPELAPEPTTGSLTVRSNVYGDQVSINGRDYGSTRLDLQLAPGKYHIVVSKTGHQAWQGTVQLTAGESQRVVAELAPFRTVQYHDGTWRGGIVTGEGTYVDDAGLRYEGDFRNRQFHGQGQAKFPDGSQYDGQWVNGKPDGRGTLRLANGDIYSGQFADGVYSGDGTLTTAGGDIYTGNWAAGELNGQGTLTSSDGILYVGSFRDGMFHGEGALTYPDGRYYEGGFADGQFHGKGTLIFADGKKYEGQFMEGRYHGQGDLFNPNGSRITGSFRYGDPYGQAKLTTAEGEIFTARTSEPGVCYRENSYRATQCPPMPGW